jgi:hypothetical protein
MNDWRSNLSPSMSTPLVFFNESNESVYRSSEWGNVYPLGALATQAVVALVGVDAVVSFYKDLDSNNKESAYKKNFKLESRQLVAVLQGYIDSIRTRKEWTLPTLETKYKEAIAKG